MTRNYDMKAIKTYKAHDGWILVLPLVLPCLPQESLDYFGERRTDRSQSSKFQGVETPSQVKSGAIRVHGPSQKHHGVE